jgi:DNA invertase Pin-like site-specific DNA recombinase
MKYVIYLRVSTDQQTESGLGLEVQRDLCQKYAKDNGNHPFIEFIDEELSGALSMEKRPGMLAAIDSLKEGDIILIAKRDRLGRDIIVNAMIESAIARKKGKLISASGDFRSDDEPTSILMRRMMDAFSEYERLIIGERTRVALQAKKKRNERVGYIPYGFRLHEDGVHLETNILEQENLKTMRYYLDAGESLRDVALKMNYMERFNRKGPWNHVSIKRVMK